MWLSLLSAKGQVSQKLYVFKGAQYLCSLCVGYGAEDMDILYRVHAKPDTLTHAELASIPVSSLQMGM